MINEWVLHQKYLALMDAVDERQLRRLRDEILTHGLPQLRVTPVFVRGFMPLKLAGIKLSLEGEEGLDPQTAEVVACLGRPYGDFYDFADERSLNHLRRICEAEGRPLPHPEER